MLLDYLKLMTFVLKKYKWLYLAFFILINFIMLPLCLSEISYSNVLQSNPQMLCFNFLQKNILLIYIIIQSFMFRFYVEKDFNEIIYTIDRTPKYIYVIIDFIIIQMIFLPLYLLIITKIDSFISYIMIFMFQCLIISSFYYFISMISSSSLIGLMVIICYLFIFIYIFLNPCIGNIILINRPIEYIPEYYFVSHTIIAVICTVVGRIFEKKYN